MTLNELETASTAELAQYLNSPNLKDEPVENVSLAHHRIFRKRQRCDELSKQLKALEYKAKVAGLNGFLAGTVEQKTDYGTYKVTEETFAKQPEGGWPTIYAHMNTMIADGATAEDIMALVSHYRVSKDYAESFDDPADIPAGITLTTRPKVNFSAKRGTTI